MTNHSSGAATSKDVFPSLEGAPPWMRPYIAALGTLAFVMRTTSQTLGPITLRPRIRSTITMWSLNLFAALIGIEIEHHTHRSLETGTLMYWSAGISLRIWRLHFLRIIPLTFTREHEDSF